MKLAKLEDDEGEEDVERRDDWSAMGWKLWEVSERERQLLERSHQELANEVKQLKHKLSEADQKEKAPQFQFHGANRQFSY